MEEKNIEQLVQETELIHQVQTEFDENNAFLKASLEAENVEVFLGTEVE